MRHFKAPAFDPLDAHQRFRASLCLTDDDGAEQDDGCAHSIWTMTEGGICCLGCGKRRDVWAAQQRAAEEIATWKE